MKKIAALISALIMMGSIAALPAQADPYASLPIQCGKVKETADAAGMEQKNWRVYVRTTIFYKACKIPHHSKWIRNISMENYYNYKNTRVDCGTMFVFKGVDWRLYFNDVQGANFSKKVETGCDEDTVVRKFTNLGNTPRLYVYAGDAGRARWHGNAKMKLGWGEPDQYANLSGYYSRYLN